VAAIDPRSRATLRFNAAQVFPTASVAKLAIVMELARQVSTLGLHWEKRVSLNPANRTAGTGVVKELQDDLSQTVRDWAVLCIVVSDNTAANQCLGLIGGVQAVNASLRAWGCKQTTVHRKITFAPAPIPEFFATGTPGDFVLLLAGLARAELLSGSASLDVLDVLSRQQHTVLLGRFLPTNAMLYSKSG
jgi:beta-lactamase class A